MVPGPGPEPHSLSWMLSQQGTSEHTLCAVMALEDPEAGPQSVGQKRGETKEKSSTATGSGGRELLPLLCPYAARLHFPTMAWCTPATCSAARDPAHDKLERILSYCG